MSGLSVRLWVRSRRICNCRLGSTSGARTASSPELPWLPGISAVTWGIPSDTATRAASPAFTLSWSRTAAGFSPMSCPRASMTFSMSSPRQPFSDSLAISTEWRTRLAAFELACPGATTSRIKGPSDQASTRPRVISVKVVWSAAFWASSVGSPSRSRDSSSLACSVSQDQKANSPMFISRAPMNTSSRACSLRFGSRQRAWTAAWMARARQRSRCGRSLRLSRESTIRDEMAMDFTASKPIRVMARLTVLTWVRVWL